jgi:hypothetical protein
VKLERIPKLSARNQERLRLRPVLVGQAPSQRSRADAPLIGGRSGTKLMLLAGLGGRDPHLSLLLYRRLFATTNLIERWPGKGRNKGDRFPMAKARRAAERMLVDLDRRLVVCVGRKVAKAFGVGHLGWLKMDGTLADVESRTVFAAFPHPSGLSHWWNDGRNEQRARHFLTKIARWTRERVAACDAGR